MPLRALFVLGPARPEAEGGASRALLALLEAARGWAPVVVGPASGPLAEALTRQGVPFRPLFEEGQAGSAGAGPALGPAAERLAQVAEAEQVDLLFGQSAWANLVAALAARGRWPVFWRLRERPRPSLRAVLLAVARGLPVRALLCASVAAAEPFAPLGPRVHVVYDGHGPLAGPEAASGADAASPGALRVGIFAPPGAAETAALREALTCSSARRPEAPWSLRLALGVAPAPCALDLLAVPALGADPLPYPLLEALACGIPIVGARVGGLGELVRDGREGFLVPPGEPGALCDRLCSLAAHPLLRARMAARARERARARFASTAAAARLGELFAAALGAPRAPAALPAVLAPAHA